MVRKRESTGFLIKQRAFLKLYILSSIEKERWYGMQILDELKASFKPYGYEPQHSEIYRALHELLEDGILSRKKIVEEGAKYKEVAVYSVKNPDELKAYKKLVKADLDRCEQLLRKAIQDNYS